MNGPDFWQFYVAFGGQMFDPKSAKLVFDQAAMTKFYKFFADAVAMGVTKKNHIGLPIDQWYAEVASGKAGFWHGGTWHYARYTGKEGLKDFFGTVQFALIPAGEKGGKPTTLTHPLVYLITKQGSDDDANIPMRQLVTIASEPRINVLHAVSSAHLAISKAETQIPLYADNRWAAEATKRLLPSAYRCPTTPTSAPIGTSCGTGCWPRGPATKRPTPRHVAPPTRRRAGSAMPSSSAESSWAGRAVAPIEAQDAGRAGRGLDARVRRSGVAPPPGGPRGRFAMSTSARLGLVMLAPAFIIVVLLFLAPVILTGVFSFTTMTTGTGIRAGAYQIDDVAGGTLRSQGVPAEILDRLRCGIMSSTTPAGGSRERPASTEAPRLRTRDEPSRRNLSDPARLRALSQIALGAPGDNP